MVVFLLLALKGSAGEGQPTFFGSTIRQYIEETSASAINPQALQLAEMSSVLVSSRSDLGQGGQDTTISPAPINENSLVAHSPVSMDYLEVVGLKRNQITEYTVQPGDLLSFIASDYGVSVNSIIWANNLRNADSLTLGQTLKIPPISGVIHRVARGDTLASVAKKYGAEEEKISDFNGLPKNGALAEGDEIIVPDGIIKSSSVATNSTPRASGTAAKPFSYLPNLGDFYMPPTSGYNWGRIHGRNGVDIANSCGTPIYAAAEGSVAIADAVGYNGGFGKYIKLIHANGTETLYAHATKLLVAAGDYAQRGQEIAKMGSTGRSTGCHLHFEVHGARNPMVKY